MFIPKKTGYTTVDGKSVRYKKGEVCYEDLSHIGHAEKVVPKQKTAVVEKETVHPRNEYPKRVGKSNYYKLSNGEKVNGKQNAIQAQAEL